MEENKITTKTEVNATELACVLGITGRRVQQLTQDGQLQRVSRGKYLLCDSVQDYMEYSSKGVSEDDIKIEQAKKKSESILKAAKASIAKMQADELAGRMHRSEDVEALTEDMIYTIRAGLMSLPGRLASTVAEASTAAEAADAIRTEVYAVMEELSNYEYDPEKYEERVRERMDWSEIDDEDS